MQSLKKAIDNKTYLVKCSEDNEFAVIKQQKISFMEKIKLNFKELVTANVVASFYFKFAFAKIETEQNNAFLKLRDQTLNDC
mgnify:CR=1 FL=1